MTGMKIKKWLKHYEDKDYFPVGNGWRPIVEKLCKDIIAIDDTVEVSQCKEKFGWLRFYISGGDDKIYNLIDKAERETSKTWT